MRRVPAARVAEIARLYAEGQTQRQIAQACGMTTGAVGKLMKRYGIETRPGGTPAQRPSLLNGRAAEVARLYAEGQTQASIAQVFGVSPTAVANLMRRHGIQIRPREDSPGLLRGPAHPNWRGDAATRTALHGRVARRRGKPQHCERCGADDPARVYDWANLTGDYGNPDDYERMCRSCHRLYDNGRRKVATSCP